MDTEQVTWDLGAERDLLADSCLKDFWNYARFGFGIALNPDGWWLDEAVHKPLCDWLTGIANRWFEMRRGGEGNQERFYILIDAARGAGKSVVVTKAFTTWLHLRDPNLATVIDSVTSTKAQEFSEVLKRFYEGLDPCALYPWLYGKWEGVDPWTKGRFTHRARRLNRSEASVETSSVETGITGDHPDHLIIDDPLTREKLRDSGNWVGLANTHVTALFPALKNNSLCILCATPYIDGDVVTNAIMLDGVKEVIGYKLPLEYQRYVRADGKWLMFFMPAADAESGEPLMPKVWPRASLDEYQRKSPADYAAQVCLRPGAGDQVPLTMEQLQDRLIERKQVPKNISITIHSDTAFKDPKRMGKGDDSVIEVWGHHPESGDVYYLEGHGSNRWRAEDYLERLVAVVQRLKKNYTIRWMTDEKTIGGKDGAWRLLLQSAFSNAGMWMPPFLEIDRRTQDKKVARIAETAGYWVDGHVYLVREAPGLAPLMWQMSRIGISEHDDWADAAADVFHPEIYRPFLPPGGDAQPPYPQRPWDLDLKTGHIDNDQARGVYDHLYAQDTWTREPIR